MLIYTLVIWLIFQVSEIVVPAVGLPEWVNTLVVVLGILGFPIAATLSWIFDLTPEGLVKDRHEQRALQAGPRNRTDYAVDFALVVAALAICTMLVVASIPNTATEAHADPVNQTESETYSGGSGEIIGDTIF